MSFVMQSTLHRATRAQICAARTFLSGAVTNECLSSVLPGAHTVECPMTLFKGPRERLTAAVKQAIKVGNFIHSPRHRDSFLLVEQRRSRILHIESACLRDTSLMISIALD